MMLGGVFVMIRCFGMMFVSVVVHLFLPYSALLQMPAL